MLLLGPSSSGRVRIGGPRQAFGMGCNMLHVLRDMLGDGGRACSARCTAACVCCALAAHSARPAPTITRCHAS
jgi:hypothetical protein